MSETSTRAAVALADPPVIPPFDGPADPVRASSVQRTFLPFVIVVTVGALIVLLEVSRLLGSIVVPSGPMQGQTATIQQATGLGAADHRDVWQIWTAIPDQTMSIANLLVTYTVFDWVFVVGYLTAFLIIAWRSVLAKIALGALLLGELIEGFAVLGLAYAPEDPFNPDVVMVAAYLKWGALALFLVFTIAVKKTRDDVWARIGRIAAALRVHALAVVVLVGLGALALVSQSGITDQLPDVQREWLRPGWLSHGAFMAAGAILAASLAFWVLGRRRSEIGRRSTKDWARLKPAKVSWWIALPYGLLWVAMVAGAATGDSEWWVAIVGAGATAGVVVLAEKASKAWQTDSRALAVFEWVLVAVIYGATLSIVIASGAPAQVDFGPMGLIAGIAVGVVGLSWLIDWRNPEESSDETRTALREAPIYADSELAPRTIWLTGDGIAILMLALAPLGLIRSFAAPAIAEMAELTTDPTVAVGASSKFWLGVVGALVIPVAWGVCLGYFDRALGPTSSTGWRTYFDPRCPTDPDRAWTTAGDIIPIVIGALIVAFGVLDPAMFAKVEPVAATVLLMTGWGLIFGGLILSFQRRAPLRAFRQLGFTTTPVITLVLICALISSTFFTDGRLHAVRVNPYDAEAQVGTEAETTDDERFTAALEARFNSWLAQASTCTVVDNSRHDPKRATKEVRPLLLVAAEGGGGRAAYWTVKALDAFDEQTDGVGDDDDSCLAAGPFVASGISGGSIGLVVDRVTRDPLTAVTDMTGPDPLARVVTGMLAGDLVAGFTGVRIPTIGNTWNDRGALLETGWENAVVTEGDDGKTRPLRNLFTREAPALEGDEPLPPFLMLNSADAVSGCRITIVQLDVASPAEPVDAGHPTTARLTSDDCGRTDSGAGYALAFDDVWAQCSTSLTWSTAALISARFPFVTPGGRMPSPDGEDCMGEAPGRPEAQLVDGGYSDDTGLAALTDLLPELLPMIAAENAKHPDDPPVMPMVMYLKNERGFELDASVKRLAAELFVPLAGMDARTLQNREAAWLERLADDLESIQVGPSAGPFGSSRIVVVSPDTVPTPVPPLGWTLSPFSRAVLDEGVDGQLEPVPVAQDSEPEEDSGTRRLYDLFAAFSD